MVGIAVFLGGIKAFYFDLSFQLGRRTVGQLWIAGAAATVNVVLNLFWIPVFGTAGAAYATVAAFGIALLLSGIYGARIFRLPAPDREAGKLVLATGGMVLVLWPLAGLTGPGWLAFQVIVGAGAYASLLWLMNVAGIRRLALATLRGLPGGLNR